MTSHRTIPESLLLVMFATTLLSGCAFFSGFAGGRSDMMVRLEQAPMDEITLGKARFVYEDFGHLSTDTLRTNAVPRKLVGAALVLYATEQSGAPPNQEALRLILEEYGFIYPDTILNWLEAPTPADVPLGFVTGRVSRPLPPVDIEVSNLSCASCHAGRLYDGDGAPTGQAWLGLPNTSLDLDAYTLAVYRSLQFGLAREADLMAMVGLLYPDIRDSELESLERFVIPETRRRIERLATTIGQPLPFRQGGPGASNGLAALKLRLGVASATEHLPDASYVSIPDLGGTALRSSLVYDGIYFPPGRPQFTRMQAAEPSQAHVDALARITAFFTTPTQGGTPRSAVAAIPAMKETFAFISSYRPPAFPGRIDETLAQRGRELYESQCQNCHGAYSKDSVPFQLISFPNEAVAIADIDTDPERLLRVTDELFDAVERSAMSPYLSVAPSSGYVAPPLTALWATAPYLHNGSVPTLWHLMHPDQRPERFQTGGHRLSWELVGIDGAVDRSGLYRFPDGYQPTSRPRIYDTSLPGKSNRGHERPFDVMSSADKLALLEFLKLI